jgi:peptidoglycan/LPS O-acetylase OafA/YrhL
MAFLSTDAYASKGENLRHQRSDKFATLHGLRGVAAFWVVLFHAKTLGLLHGTPFEDAGIFTRLTFDYGRGGVAVFFVLSGFVIAHSVFGKAVDLRFIGRFALRRSIRLDPPYWASIIVALAIFSYRAVSSGTETVIPWASVAAHIFYLQELLGAKEIQVIYWTLTYEIQFYIIYIFSVWAVGPKVNAGGRKWAAVALAGGLLTIAFIGALQTTEWAPRGVFANYWFAFAAGVLSYFGGYRRSNVALALAILLACAMLSSAPATREVFNSPAAITCLGLAALGRADLLNSVLHSLVFQKLGSISYSLYLVHIPALIIGLSLSSRLFDLTFVGRLGAFATSIALALLLASLFWWAIERPAHALAKRIGSPRKVPSELRTA